MKKTIVTVTLIFLYFNCATLQTVVNPVRNDFYEYEGKKFLTLQDSLFRLDFCFEELFKDQIVFFLEIENHSDSTIDFNPALIYLQERQDVIGEKNIINSINVDREINQIQSAMKNNETDYQFNSTMDKLCLASSCFFASIDIMDNNTENDATNVSSVVGSVIQIQETKDNYEQNKTILTNTLEYWEKSALRKTDLLPHSPVGGFIHFPFYSDLHDIKVVIPILNYEYGFDYTISKEKP